MEQKRTPGLPKIRFLSDCIGQHLIFFAGVVTQYFALYIGFLFTPEDTDRIYLRVMQTAGGFTVLYVLYVVFVKRCLAKSQLLNLAAVSTAIIGVSYCAVIITHNMNPFALMGVITLVPGLFMIWLVAEVVVRTLLNLMKMKRHTE